MSYQRVWVLVHAARRDGLDEEGPDMGVDVVLYRAVGVSTGRCRVVPAEVLPDPAMEIRFEGD
ncbi:hypothetical protein ABT346_01815 [Micromonospora peucetia]|uniref:hypothetical protein n=1 Tax=Micromonospora peucetia TaxID=47871 RepID=UPI003321DF0F